MRKGFNDLKALMVAVVMVFSVMVAIPDTAMAREMTNQDTVQSILRPYAQAYLTGEWVSLDDGSDIFLGRENMHIRSVVRVDEDNDNCIVAANVRIDDVAYGAVVSRDDRGLLLNLIPGRGPEGHYIKVTG